MMETQRVYVDWYNTRYIRSVIGDVLSVIGECLSVIGVCLIDFFYR